MFLFAWWNTKKSSKEAAVKIYKTLVEQARNPKFYTEYGVPDTFDGRFEMIALHVGLMLERVSHEEDGKDLSQALFDHMFLDMDMALREIGIGDLSVPKHMKRMMKALKGRTQNYKEHMDNPEELREAVKRNVYGTLEDVAENNVAGVMEYLKGFKGVLENQDFSAIRQGEIAFGDI